MNRKLKEDRSSVYNPMDDWRNTYTKNTTRRPKLTLRHINKLRKMRESRKIDMADREKVWSVMYGMPADNEEGPMDI